MPAPKWSRGLADPRDDEGRAAAAAKKAEAEGPSTEQLRQGARLPPIDPRLGARVAQAYADAERERVAERAHLAAEGDELAPLSTNRFLQGVIGAAPGTRREPPPSSRGPASYARAHALANAQAAAENAPLSAYERLAGLGRPRTLRPVVASALPPHIEAKVQEASQRSALVPPTVRSGHVPPPMPAPVRESVRYATSPLPPPVHELVLPLTEQAGPPSSTLTPMNMPASPVSVVPPTIRDRYTLTTPYQKALESCSASIVNRTIEQFDGNKSAAASALGLTREGLYGILRRSGWSIPEAERAKHAKSGSAGARARWGG